MRHKSLADKKRLHFPDCTICMRCLQDYRNNLSLISCQVNSAKFHRQGKQTIAWIQTSCCKQRFNSVWLHFKHWLCLVSYCHKFEPHQIVQQLLISSARIQAAYTCQNAMRNVISRIYKSMPLMYQSKYLCQFYCQMFMK